jgi:hypothetical protein
VSVSVSVSMSVSVSVSVSVRSERRFYRVLDWALHQKSLLTLLWRRLRLPA